MKDKATPSVCEMECGRDLVECTRSSHSRFSCPPQTELPGGLAQVLPALPPGLVGPSFPAPSTWISYPIQVRLRLHKAEKRAVA